MITDFLKTNFFRFSTLIVCLLAVDTISAQSSMNQFESEIQAFEKQDQENGYQEDFILFVGSSSIRLWETLESDMEGYKVLNRGFGGAQLSDLNLFWSRILAEHKPKMVILYCGENDIHEGSGVSQTVKRFKDFQDQYDRDLSGVPLIYITMKPSPSRWESWKKFRAADKKIAKLLSPEILSLKSDKTYLDLSSLLLREDGTPDPSFFIEDELHMNADGYERWTESVRKSIEDNMK